MVNWKDKEHISGVVAASSNKQEVLHKLGLSTSTGANYQRLKRYIELYQLDISHLDKRASWSPLWSTLTKQQLEKITSGCLSYAEVLQQLGIAVLGSNYKTLKKYIDKYEINVSHFNSKRRGKPSKIENNDLFIENSQYCRSTVRKRVIEEGLIEYKCSKCGNPGEWMGVSLSLQLEHKNGINNDDRLENLEFLCPNCHSQTPTYAGRNRQR